MIILLMKYIAVNAFRSIWQHLVKVNVKTISRETCIWLKKLNRREHCWIMIEEHLNICQSVNWWTHYNISIMWYTTGNLNEWTVFTYINEGEYQRTQNHGKKKNKLQNNCV